MSEARVHMLAHRKVVTSADQRLARRADVAVEGSFVGEPVSVPAAVVVLVGTSLDRRGDSSIHAGAIGSGASVPTVGDNV